MLDGEIFHTGAMRAPTGRFADTIEADSANEAMQERMRERALLAKLGLSKPFLDLVEERAAVSGASLEAEVLADGRVKEASYYGALARFLGLPFQAEIPATSIVDTPDIDHQLRYPRILRVDRGDQAPITLIAPTIRAIVEEKARLDANPALRLRLAVTTPSAMRAALWAAGAERRGRNAAYGLFETRPASSARIVCSGRQGAWCGAIAAILAMSAWIAPAMLALALHLALSLAYLMMLLLRGFALQMSPPLTRRTSFSDDPGSMPVYTVLVPLYHETEVAPQLIERLDRLNWPRSRLDVKLLCEQDDAETIAALEALPLAPEYEVVRIPDIGPRTKPKALNYGLAGARGELLVIYDAEDRPHPDQLVEAWHHFRSTPDSNACFQSPLVIANGGEGNLPGLFALEYSALFRRLLPLLADYHLPLPLGGTSNHFRTQPLREVGGWDPFNVTEDADLGIRLHRAGYVTELLTRPTVEDAPVAARVWLGQRSRWYKGWMQTWLVHMRNPLGLLHELGGAGFLAFHVVISGLLLSALAHPLILTFFAFSAWNFTTAAYHAPLEQMLFLVDLVNIFGAYTVFTLMGWGAMSKDERKRLTRARMFVPVYWLLMSAAAWRALWELQSRPFFWNKTPHAASTRPIKGAAAPADR